jgi:hypothetical protein
VNYKSSKSPLNLELGARAEAKFEVKAEVPPASVGRFVDALTDLFRPFSEARGLKADLIRLQREEVAIRIARLAREQADAREVKLVSPPLKVLIPLFERASQEELDGKFILEAWAKLVVSAALRFAALNPSTLSSWPGLSRPSTSLGLATVRRGCPQQVRA